MCRKFEIFSLSGFYRDIQPGLIGSHRGGYQIHENSHRPRGRSVTPGNLWSLKQNVIWQMIGRGCWVLLGLNQLLQCTKNLLVIALVANRLLWLPVVVADASLLLSKLS